MGRGWQTGPVLSRWTPLLRIAFAVALALHLWGLYTPGEPESGMLFPHADKVLHFLGFAIPASLAVLLFRHWWPIVAFAGNAVLSELIQHFFLPNRDGDVFDLLADLSGLLVAVAVWWWVQRAAATASGSPTSSTSASAERPNA